MEERFFKHLGCKTPTGCILWSGVFTAFGYGWMGGEFLAHRVAHELLVGPIPKGLHVLHHCDNPPCINPLHLYLGTNSDNIADKMARGRQAKGEMFHKKLTTANVNEIRSRHEVGENQSKLAEEFGVHQSAISYIVRRKRWKHV